MTRISLLSGLDLSTPGSGYCDGETSAPGVTPGRKYCTKQAQGSPYVDCLVEDYSPPPRALLETACRLFPNSG